MNGISSNIGTIHVFLIRISSSKTESYWELRASYTGIIAEKNKTNKVQWPIVVNLILGKNSNSFQVWLVLSWFATYSNLKIHGHMYLK